MADARADFIRGLRGLADFYAARPELKMPSAPGFSIVSVSGKGELVEMARLMSPCNKEFDDLFYRVIRMFGPIKLKALDYRANVCERVVTGTRVVPERIIAATEGEIIPEHEVEIVVWKCPDSLLTSVGGE